MTPSIGELAALGTALCYSISSIFFTYAGREFGPVISNRLRLVIAIILLATTHWLIFGHPFPLNASPDRWLWLGLSGIVGLAIGDLFLFRTYVTLGPRMGLLFLSLSPALASVLAWFLLRETLSFSNIIGIFLTLAGLAWVVLESSNHRSASPANDPSIHKKLNWAGIISGLVAASGQAGGVVLAKVGLYDNFPAISGNVIRMTCAFFAFWLVTLVQGQVVTTIKQANQKRSGLAYLLVGAVLGPLIGVSLSLFAVQNTNVGIATTIIALPPIFLLPVGHFLFKERLSWQSIAGTFISVIGVGLLFWL